MKIAVLIITYTSAKQTKRMIESLNNGNFDFYIHLDKKVDISTHSDLLTMPNVYFVKDRVDIKWAGFTTVEAALHGIKAINDSGKTYDYINLITGQDYPIKSAAYIEEFLTHNKGKEFIYYSYFDTDWTEAKARVDRYHLTDFRFKGKYTLERVINKITPRRKFPLDIPLCGRETFWTLSQECATYVWQFINNHPRLFNFLRYTWGSDEFIFQSIIMDSPFKEQVVNNNYRYISWPPNSARPKVLTSADFNDIMASDAIFARKLDINTDSIIFDLLDAANLQHAQHTDHGIHA
jgi:Core-2/I-Branching enzyme